MLGVVAEEPDQVDRPRADPLPLLRRHPREHGRDRVAVGGRGASAELAPDQRAHDRLEAQVRGDHHLAPVVCPAEPLEVGAGRLPRRVVEERVARDVDRELDAELVLEVHRVEHDRLSRALFHRGLQADARGDRVRQAVARRRRGREPQTVLDVRWDLQEAAQELDPLAAEVGQQTLGDRRPKRPLDLLLDRGAALVERPLPLLAGVAELEPVGRLAARSKRRSRCRARPRS